MKNTLTTIPGLLTPFSQQHERAELYNYKTGHKVVWLEPDTESPAYWLRDLFDMAIGKSVSKKSMRRAARILSQATGKVIVYLPWVDGEINNTSAQPAAIAPTPETTPKTPTRKEVTETLYWADQIPKNKAGHYIARQGFYYKLGNSPEKTALRVLEAFPQAIIVDSGEHWAPFKGGASLKTSSHFWVEFKF